MKKFILFFSILALGTSIFLSACGNIDSCESETIYEVWKPIYKKVDEIRLDVKAEAAKEVSNAGQVYFYDHYIFISEVNEGIHIIDNQNPTAPRNLSFVKIPGNTNLAVKDNILYADSYIDLLSIDISNPEKPTLANRVDNVFTNFSLVQNFGYLIDYEKTNETQTIDCNSSNYGKEYFFNGANIDVAFDTKFDGAGFASTGVISSPKPKASIGGSFARFTIASDYLYALNQANLLSFDLKTTAKPVIKGRITVDWGVETLFPYKDKLFVGANNGLFIYDLKKPENPVRLSKFQHARACDPVYVKDDKAYVTLRNGTACQGFVNQLEVLDVSDVTDPKIIKTFPMEHPHGLGIEGNTLFLCEGKFGVKTFDIKDVNAIDKNRLEAITTFEAYDVIPLPKEYSTLDKPLAMFFAADGFYQYDVTNKNKMAFLSKFSYKKR